MHRDRYFVVGDGAELVCYETDYGEDCSTISQMWMSADGTQWQELLTTTGSAVAATDIGSGPLGLLAFGGEIGGEQQSRSLYVSGDGALWEEVPGLALLNPGKPMWWWTSRPAVGTDTVVLVGSSYREAESGFNGEESPILIVGRLLDR